MSVIWEILINSDGDVVAVYQQTYSPSLGLAWGLAVIWGFICVHQMDQVSSYSDS